MMFLSKSTRSTHPARRARAFTFVELLVAIAIVFILASLLLVLGVAMRKSARRQACLTAFEHVKNAQAIYFSQRGALVDETAMDTWDNSTPKNLVSNTWYVTVGANAPRPMTTMEYFCFMIRLGCSDAYQHLQLLGDVLAPSTELNGPAVGGHACYGTVRIYSTLVDATAKTNCLYTLYDPWPGNTDIPNTLAQPLAQSSTGPLMTVIDPWDKGLWNPSVFYTTTANGTAFYWRQHELDYRALTAQYDNTRGMPPPQTAPPYMWYAIDAQVPPYLPFSEGMLVSSPGPDGLWAVPDAQAVPPQHGLTNRGIPTGQFPCPPFIIQPGTQDAQALDNLYSSQGMQ